MEESTFGPGQLELDDGQCQVQMTPAFEIKPIPESI
jgi:hypothetical protein